MSFILKGFQIAALQLKGWFKSKTSIQEYIEMKYKTHIKLVHELYGMSFQHNVKKLRIKHLTLLLVVITPYACWFLWRANYIEDFKWRYLHFQIGVHFEERYILKGQNTFEGALKTSISNTHSGATPCLQWGSASHSNQAGWTWTWVQRDPVFEPWKQMNHSGNVFSMPRSTWWLGGAVEWKSVGLPHGSSRAYWLVAGCNPTPSPNHPSQGSVPEKCPWDPAWFTWLMFFCSWSG